MSGPETPSKPPMPGDEALEALLRGEGPELAAWKTARGTGGPPPALDAAILVQAASAVAAPAAKVVPLRRNRYQLPIALAATMVLGVSLMLKVVQSPEWRNGRLGPEAANEAAPAGAAAPAPAPVAPMEAPVVAAATEMAQKPVLMDSAPMAAAPASAPAAAAAPEPGRERTPPARPAPPPVAPQTYSTAPAPAAAPPPPPPRKSAPSAPAAAPGGMAADMALAAPAAEPSPQAFSDQPAARDEAPPPSAAAAGAVASAPAPAPAPTAPEHKLSKAYSARAMAPQASRAEEAAMAADAMEARREPPAAAKRKAEAEAGMANREVDNPPAAISLLRAAMTAEAAGTGVDRQPVLVCVERNFKVLSSGTEEMRFELRYRCVGEMDAAGQRFTPGAITENQRVTARLERGGWRLLEQLQPRHLDPEGALALLNRLRSADRLTAEARAAREAELRAAVGSGYLP